MTDNEMIAEFMGLSVYQTYEEMQAVPLEDLKPWILPEQATYHASWDQLMAVVDKIHSTSEYTAINMDREGVFLHLTRELNCEYFNNDMAGGKINAVYSAVVFFIKWHNSLTTTL